MTTPAQWSQDLTRVLEATPFVEQPTTALFKLDKLGEPAGQLLEADELADHLAALGPVTGWLLEASAVRELWDEVLECQSLPLGGEWCREDQHWQLEHIHGQQWRLHHYRLTPAEDASATHLGMQVHQLKADGEGWLYYWCLWQPQNQCYGELKTIVPEQQLALFTGFNAE